jgi:hypothetical protein
MKIFIITKLPLFKKGKREYEFIDEDGQSNFDMKIMRIKILILIFVIIIISMEAGLRYFGFCDAPLSRQSDKYEYIFQPDQNRCRFRKRIKYNAESMRSDEINPASIKILGLGDSVINGGSFNDQDSIATSILSSELSAELDTVVQVLNISAGSWGPDNCNAYLDEKGLFNAKVMLLVVSSHDACDNMDFQPVVGIDPAYPDKQYKLAWFELLDRYVAPKLKKRKEISRKTAGVGSSTVFNTGFRNLYNKALTAAMPMIIYLHAETSEMKTGKYNEMGQQIIEFANTNNILLIKQLDYQPTDMWYRDDIHLNHFGQHKMAEIMKFYIKGMIE